MKTKSLEMRILEILHVYFQQHPGELKMSYNELVRISEADRGDVIQCLHGLREEKWINFVLTDGAETGQVWLTQAGIRIAGDKPGDAAPHRPGSSGMIRTPLIASLTFGLTLFLTFLIVLAYIHSDPATKPKSLPRNQDSLYASHA
ncbi:hypothetical protein QUF72_20055 [Desulfobacterales bacterium HSG2]|nr:hypothetical protein [Desulfobacterales bacterium HSG2]